MKFVYKKTNTMRRFFRMIFFIPILLIFLGCAGMQPAPPADPVCPPPDGQPSWICEQSAKLNIQPENIADFIFDASVVAVMADVDRNWICEFTGELGQWYADRRPLSYSALIGELAGRVKLIDDPDKLLLLNSALNRHLRMYVNTQIISAYDDHMLELWWQNYRRDMMCR